MPPRPEALQHTRLTGGTAEFPARHRRPRELSHRFDISQGFIFSAMPTYLLLCTRLFVPRNT